MGYVSRCHKQYQETATASSDAFGRDKPEMKFKLPRPIKIQWKQDSICKKFNSPVENTLSIQCVKYSLTSCVNLRRFSGMNSVNILSF